MTETQQRDVVDVLTADHREIDRIFTELEPLLGRTDAADLERKRDLVDEVTIDLVKHSVAEETRVYPKIERQVDKDEAEHAKEEHDQAEDILKRLERLNADDPEFDRGVQELIRDVRHHIQEEEGRMFAELRATFSRDDLVAMAKQVELVKKIAPTRPHPLTPNEPGIRMTVGPIVSLIDHLRDAVTGRGKAGD